MLTIQDTPNDILGEIMAFVPQSWPLCAIVCKQWLGVIGRLRTREAAEINKMTIRDRFAAETTIRARYYVNIADYFDVHKTLYDPAAPKLLFKFCPYNICNELAVTGNLALIRWLLENKLARCVHFCKLVNNAIERGATGAAAKPLCWFLEKRQYLYGEQNPMFASALQCPEINKLLTEDAESDIALLLSAMDSTTATGVGECFDKIHKAAKETSSYPVGIKTLICMLIFNATHWCRVNTVRNDQWCRVNTVCPNQSGKATQIDFIKQLITSVHGGQIDLQGQVDAVGIDEGFIDWLIEHGYLRNLTMPKTRAGIEKYAAKITSCYDDSYFPLPEDCLRAAEILKHNPIFIRTLTEKCCDKECSHKTIRGLADKSTMACQYADVLDELIARRTKPRFGKRDAELQITQDTMLKAAYAAINCGNVVLAKKLRSKLLNMDTAPHPDIKNYMESAALHWWLPSLNVTDPRLVELMPTFCGDDNTLFGINGWCAKTICNLDVSAEAFIHFLPRFASDYSGLFERLIRQQIQFHHYSLRNLFKKAQVLLDRSARLSAGTFAEIATIADEKNNKIIIDWLIEHNCLENLE